VTAAEQGLVVVTGGCGFIGGHLVRRLSQMGRSVRVLDDLSNGDLGRLPAGVDFREGDVADPAAVLSAVTGATVVFHLAAVASVQVSNKRWLDSHLTNSGGAVAVMEALRNESPNAAFVYASSAAVYGDVPLIGDERITEKARCVPLAPYGIDKLATEWHAGVGGTLFGLRSFGLRFFNVFGPGQAPDSPYSGVISRFVAQAGSGGPITIFGDGEQTRDFVHIDDVVSALLLAESAASTAAPVANICTGLTTSVNELANVIAGQFKPAPPLVCTAGRIGDIRRSVGDPTLAWKLLGWRSAVSLGDGLADLVKSEASEAR
jgi:UDP-glucose 4-epimerase